jgi:hypothetical protein
MKENQHNDNLERFFKANLENYSPSPSTDFWSRMETAIPPKPPSFLSKSAKWVLLGLLALVTVLVLWFWQRDRTQIDRLKKTVAQQEQQIQAMNEAVGQAEPERSRPVALPEKNGDALAKDIAPSAPQGTTPSRVASQNNKAAQPIRTSGPSVAKPRKSQQQPQGAASLAVKTDLPSQREDNQMPGNTDGVKHELQAHAPGNAADAPNPIVERLPASSTLAPNPIAPKTSLVAYKDNRAVLVKPSVLVRQQAYPRYAVEAVGKVFRMPLGVLFQQDTFLTGRTNISYGMGFNISYEVTSKWAVQAGYQYTNLRARRLALRYNSFPVAVQKRWGWGRRKHVELKLGASLNSLVSARTDSDGQSVKGLKTTWLGLHSSLATTWALTENLDLIAGPTAGLSLSPMTTGRRSWEIGVGAGLRYHL